MIDGQERLGEKYVKRSDPHPSGGVVPSSSASNGVRIQSHRQ
jgi:hypothetical protein